MYIYIYIYVENIRYKQNLFEMKLFISLLIVLRYFR